MSCCVCRASNKPTERNPVVRTLHQFPKDAELRKIWISKIPIENLSPRNCDKVFSAHFREEDYESYGISVNGVKKIRLVRGAIPLVESNGESVKHVS